MLIPIFIMCSLISYLQATSYENVRQEILQNFPAIKLNQKLNFTEKKELDFPAVALSDYEKHQALFALLGASETGNNQSLIDGKTISDLGLFFYNAHSPNYTVLEKIYRGASLNGKIALAALIASPTDHVEELHAHQQLIAYFLQNKNLTSALMPLFQELAAIEEQLYSLWNTDDILYTDYVKKTFYRGDFKKYSGPTGSFWLEFNRRRKDWKPVIDFLLLDTINTVIRNLHMKYARNMENASTQPGWLKAVTSLNKEDKDLTEEQEKTAREENLYAGLSTIISLIPPLIELDQWRRTLRSYRRLAMQIRQRTRVLVTLKRLVERIFSLIAEDSVLASKLHGYTAIKRFISGNDREQASFLKLLESQTLQSNSYHFSYIGKVLQIIPQMLAAKEGFSSLFRGIGLLEAYVGLARLMQEKATTQAPWCFVEYCNKQAPYLALTDFRHPLIPAQQAILNTITLGDDNNPGMIVTGPNASGKSMSIRAIALCVLLGQTVGIAPARRVLLTPMSKILTFLNPIDNIAQGRSLFQVETDRISEIVQSAYALPPTQFSFIIVDELLSSTAPTEGEAASFGICYGLSQLKNCMPIAATHFPRLAALPEHTNGFFSNYHVSAKKEDNGDIIHTFKLEKGQSQQVIAIDLARKAGFDSDILARAEEFLYKKGIKRDRMRL